MIRRVSGENSEGPRPGRRNRLPGSRLRALAIVRGQEGADDQLQARYWKFVFEHFDQPPSGLDPIHLEELISYAERCEKVGAPINSQARLEMLESNTSSSFDPSALSDRAQSFLRSLSRRPEAEKELEALRAGKSVVEALKARRIHIPDELLGPGALDPLRAAIQAEQKRLRDALGERLRGLLDRGERGEIFFLLDLEGPMATSKLLELVDDDPSLVPALGTPADRLEELGSPLLLTRAEAEEWKALTDPRSSTRGHERVLEALRKRVAFEKEDEAASMDQVLPEKDPRRGYLGEG